MACFLGPEVRHEIFNDGEQELVRLWVIGPPGLEDFFQSIDRPRTPVEAAPAPSIGPATLWRSKAPWDSRGQRRNRVFSFDFQGQNACFSDEGDGFHAAVKLRDSGKPIPDDVE
jgi:hypothetical protein